MFFERHIKPLATKSVYLSRIIKYSFYSAIILGGSIFIGMLGYRYFCDLGWVDAFLNASMILTGMGPVNQMKTDTAKIFASFYALYSGVAFLTTVAVLFAPSIHRFLHKLHIDEDDK